jgi:hypothetical protein
MKITDFCIKHQCHYACDKYEEEECEECPCTIDKDRCCLECAVTSHFCGSDESDVQIKDILHCKVFPTEDEIKQYLMMLRLED